MTDMTGDFGKLLSSHGYGKKKAENLSVCRILDYFTKKDRHVRHVRHFVTVTDYFD